MTWRVARSLDVLLAEVNAAAPNRSKVSDGSIGDAAHATRDSDHNPWVIHQGVGVVRARDFTHDPAHGCDSDQLARRIVDLGISGHPALASGAYVISRSRIWSFDRRAEGWRTYTGSNPHDHHCHVSVSLAQTGYDSPHPWGVMGAVTEDAMALDEQVNKDRTVKQVLNRLDGFIDASRNREQTILRAVRALSSAPEEIAAAVAEDLRNDLAAGGGVDVAELQRIVFAQATRAINARLGSLDEPRK